MTIRVSSRYHPGTRLQHVLVPGHFFWSDQSFSNQLTQSWWITESRTYLIGFHGLNMVKYTLGIKKQLKYE